MGGTLRRMRCSGACGGRMEAAWLDRAGLNGQATAGAAARTGGAGIVTCQLRSSPPVRRSSHLQSNDGGPAPLAAEPEAVEEGGLGWG